MGWLATVIPMVGMPAYLHNNLSLSTLRINSAPMASNAWFRGENSIIPDFPNKADGFRLVAYRNHFFRLIMIME